MRFELQELGRAIERLSQHGGVEIELMEGDDSSRELTERAWESIRRRDYWDE